MAVGEKAGIDLTRIKAGVARRGPAGLGKARQGRQGPARRGWAWLGKAGGVWRGKARRGKAGKEKAKEAEK